jgi:DNA-binding PadR family transcriptional regulator
MQTSKLIKSRRSQWLFHTIIKSLHRYGLVKRELRDDRTVYYSISPVGQKVLNLSKPVLEEIKNISSSYIQEMRFPDYKKDIVDYATRNVNADSDMLAK